jgi:hypothetical protein
MKFRFASGDPGEAPSPAKPFSGPGPSLFNPSPVRRGRRGLQLTRPAWPAGLGEARAAAARVTAAPRSPNPRPAIPALGRPAASSPALAHPGGWRWHRSGPLRGQGRRAAAAAAAGAVGLAEGRASPSFSAAVRAAWHPVAPGSVPAPGAATQEAGEREETEEEKEKRRRRR